MAFGYLKHISTAFQRSLNTTPYLANQIVAPGTTADILLITPVGGNANNDWLGDQIPGAKGYITKLILTSDQNITSDLQVLLFSVSPGAPVDGTPLTFTYTQAKNCIGVIPLNNPLLADAGSTILQNVDIRVSFSVGPRAGLYAVIQSVAGWTPTSGQNFNLVMAADICA